MEGMTRKAKNAQAGHQSCEFVLKCMKLGNTASRGCFVTLGTLGTGLQTVDHAA
jgi:hypothetical protein